MAPKCSERLKKKTNYLTRVKDLMKAINRMFIVKIDFVGSKQLQEIRAACRGKAIFVFGKNTLIRTALKQYQTENDVDMTPLLEVLVGNVGFCFCQTDFDLVREVIKSKRVPAAAKVGVLAPDSVTIPAGPTNLDPSQTSFFQALNIGTKILKGQIEIVSAVEIVTKGNKIQASQQVLLQKLNIKPFEYGLEILHIYDNGNVFSAAVLDITDDVLVIKFLNGIKNVAAFSREVGLPTEASIPHSLAQGFKYCASLCAEIDYSFPEIEKLKQYVADPSKFVVASQVGIASNDDEVSKEANKDAIAQEEEDDEEEEEAEFDLFG